MFKLPESDFENFTVSDINFTACYQRNVDFSDGDALRGFLRLKSLTLELPVCVRCSFFGVFRKMMENTEILFFNFARNSTDHANCLYPGEVQRLADVRLQLKKNYNFVQARKSALCFMWGRNFSQIAALPREIVLSITRYLFYLNKSVSWSGCPII